MSAGGEQAALPLAKLAENNARQIVWESTLKLLSDPAVVALVAQDYVEQQIKVGAIIRADRLLLGPTVANVPPGYVVVPGDTIDVLRTNLDELRTAIGEHLAGNDHTERLLHLLEHGVDLDAYRPLAIGDPTGTPADGDDTDDGAYEPTDDDARRRPDGMPYIGEVLPCAVCGEPTPGPNDHHHQALLSFIRWSEVLCGADHRAWVDERRSA